MLRRLDCCARLFSMEHRILLALDFDNTVVNTNTDMEVQTLAGRPLPEEIRKMFSDQCWTDFMQAVFVFLHENGVKSSDIRHRMESVRFAEGMQELMRAAGSLDHVETIIISDANTFFIETILDHNQLKIRKIFSNPAEFDTDGCLRIRYFHEQNWCQLSEKNMCKGQILDEYVKSRSDDGILFKKIVYVGDGRNDYCPILRLRSKDVAAVRKGYFLAKKLNDPDAEKAAAKIAASIHYWESGLELIPYLKL